ncbi:hypothetical protein IAT38_003626 [Cryptococcus sp. DSM 104549]
MPRLYDDLRYAREADAIDDKEEREDNAIDDEEEDMRVAMREEDNAAVIAHVRSMIDAYAGVAELLKKIRKEDFGPQVAERAKSASGVIANFQTILHEMETGMERRRLQAQDCAAKRRQEREMRQAKRRRERAMLRAKCGVERIEEDRKSWHRRRRLPLLERVAGVQGSPAMEFSLQQRVYVCRKAREDVFLCRAILRANHGQEQAVKAEVKALLGQANMLE